MIDGIFAGVGSVLSFLPIIVVLFFFLSILEDTGYMARVAFFVDQLLRKIGLSGRSIVPMLIGFGCTVPGVMASRTLPSERDRKMTILLTPFMSCSAKLPIYAFFTAAFFPEHGTLVMIALYFGGIIMGILMALILRGTLFNGEAVPFVMELPNYRMPGAKNVGLLLWDKANPINASNGTGRLADRHCPYYRIFSKGKRCFHAVYPLWKNQHTGISMTSLSAASLLVFCLLYTPCVAAIASIKRELGGKWALTVVILQCVVAWIAAYIVYLIGGFFF